MNHNAAGSKFSSCKSTIHARKPAIKLQKQSSLFKNRAFSQHRQTSSLANRPRNHRHQQKSFSSTPLTSSTHSFDKEIPASPGLFAYLERFGRRDLPAVNDLRTDTLKKRHNIIRLMLEPITCSFLEFKLREMKATRVLEVGTFTGVTSTALAMHIKNAQSTISSAQSTTDLSSLNALHGILDNIPQSALDSVRKTRISLQSQYNKQIQLYKKELKEGQSISILPPSTSSTIAMTRLEANLTLPPQPTALDAPISVSDIMLSDSSYVITTIEKNHLENSNFHAKKFSSISSSPHISSSPSPSLSSLSHLPPMVLTIDTNITNIQDVSLEHWNKHSLIGSPLVFLPGNAHDITTRLANSTTLKGTFDMVFIDADKKGYKLYYENALSLLRQDGIICVDNVLWKGHVVDCASDVIDTELLGGVQYSRNFTEANTSTDTPPSSSSTTLSLSTASQTNSMTENAKYLHAFNKFVHADPRVDLITLPIGDGLTLIRKL